MYFVGTVKTLRAWQSAAVGLKFLHVLVTLPQPEILSFAARAARCSHFHLLTQTGNALGAGRRTRPLCCETLNLTDTYRVPRYTLYDAPLFVSDIQTAKPSRLFFLFYCLILAGR